MKISKDQNLALSKKKNSVPDIINVSRNQEKFRREKLQKKKNKDKLETMAKELFTKCSSNLKKEKDLVDTTDGSSTENYKPGMLSNYFQKTKYNCLLLPWDPSFGMSNDNALNTGADGEKKLKINPLFDLSKRQNLTPKPLIDETQNTVFVANLPHGISEKRIAKLFRKCGSVRKIKLQKIKYKTASKTSPPRRNASIIFDDSDSCEKALTLNGVLFKDCHLQVKKASSGNCNPAINRSVFVGNISFQATNEDLWKAFEKCGELENIKIVVSKGYGFVNFKVEEAVEKALKLDGLSILNRNIRVSKMMPNQSKKMFFNKKNSTIPLFTNYINNVKNIKHNDKLKQKSFEETDKTRGCVTAEVKTNQSKKNKADLNMIDNIQPNKLRKSNSKQYESTVRPNHPKNVRFQQENKSKMEKRETNANDRVKVESKKHIKPLIKTNKPGDVISKKFKSHSSNENMNTNGIKNKTVNSKTNQKKKSLDNEVFKKIEAKKLTLKQKKVKKST